MPDGTPAPPGTHLVIAVLAAAMAGTCWFHAGRVTLPATDSPLRAGRPPEWPDMRIDVNDAGPAGLDALPGIGPRLADRIAADREARGRFATLDDLTRVPGVGPRTVERIRPYAIASR